VSELVRAKPGTQIANAEYADLDFRLREGRAEQAMFATSPRQIRGRLADHGKSLLQNNNADPKVRALIAVIVSAANAALGKPSKGGARAGPPAAGLGFALTANRPSRCMRLRASLRARRIASAFSRALRSDGFS